MRDLPRIGFDAMYLEQPRTGSGQYALNVWQGLKHLLPSEQLRLLIPADAPKFVHDLAGDRAQPSRIPPLHGRIRKIWWEQIGRPSAVRDAGIELVHVPYFAAPAYLNARYVVTIHDVIPLILPAYKGSLAMQAYMQAMRRTVSQAALVLTDSEHSSQDIQRKLGISKRRIRVIPLAAGAEYSPASTVEEKSRLDQIRQRYDLKRPFILNVGGFDRRKQLPELLAAFAMARPQFAEDHDLVIVGSAHTGNQQLYPPIEPLIRRYGLQDRVKLTGFVDGEDFIDLYRAAELFAFVSAYEGFGLDPLEAMACGTPVLCSNRSSLPEVVGKSGYLIDPVPREIARGMVRVLNDAPLRAELAGRGLERAALFSWERTVDQTLEAYRDAMQGSERN